MPKPYTIFLTEDNYSNIINITENERFIFHKYLSYQTQIYLEFILNKTQQQKKEQVKKDRPKGSPEHL